MIRPFSAVLLLLSVLLLTPAAADPPARVGRLAYLEGAVALAPAGLEDEWSGALLNRPVTRGDRFWTDLDGLAEIEVGANALRLGSGTSLDVLELDDRTLQLSLAQGTLHLSVRRLGRDERIEIDTPAAALTVLQPGDYRIDVDPDGRAVVAAARRGTLDAAGREAAAAVYAGHSVTLYADAGAVEIDGLPPADAFDRFCEEREQRAAGAQAARHVAPDMTGYADLDAYGTWRTLPDYGTAWFPDNVDANWAPYRDGRWLWIEPWGWTWVDAQPWGFAPFHYGRWIVSGGRWCWHPGPRHGRLYYAPALVVFVSGAGHAGAAPLVGWIPLGWREPYFPWYAASPSYVRDINPALPGGPGSMPRARHGSNYAHRAALTAVAGSVFARGGAVRPSTLPPRQAEPLARAPVLAGNAPLAPVAESLAVQPARVRPPPHLSRRPVVGLHAPPRPAPFAERQARTGAGPGPFQVQPLPPAAAAPPLRAIQPPQARIGRPNRPAAGGPLSAVPAPLPTPPSRIVPARPPAPVAPPVMPPVPRAMPAMPPAAPPRFDPQTPFAAPPAPIPPQPVQPAPNAAPQARHGRPSLRGNPIESQPAAPR